MNSRRREQRENRWGRVHSSRRVGTASQHPKEVHRRLHLSTQECPNVPRSSMRIPSGSYSLPAPLRKIYRFLIRRNPPRGMADSLLLSDSAVFLSSYRPIACWSIFVPDRQHPRIDLIRGGTYPQVSIKVPVLPPPPPRPPSRIPLVTTLN